MAGGDPALFALNDALSALPAPRSRTPLAPAAGIAVPLELDLPDARLSLLSTTTVFGTATDVTLAELTLETFFPADAPTRRYFLENAQ